MTKHKVSNNIRQDGNLGGESNKGSLVYDNIDPEGLKRISQNFLVIFGASLATRISEL